MATTIEINGTTYPMKFGFGAVKIIGDQWGLSGPQKVVEQFTQFEEGSFDQIEAIGALICAGITNATKAEAPEVYDVIDVVMLSPEIVETVIAEFGRSLQRPGNPKPAPKGRQSKKG